MFTIFYPCGHLQKGLKSPKAAGNRQTVKKGDVGVAENLVAGTKNRGGRRRITHPTAARNSIEIAFLRDLLANSL